MPRGDLVYRDMPNKGGMRKQYGMPPSHNCVWVESKVSRDQLRENWEKAFHKSPEKTNGGWECTCDYKEIKSDNKVLIVRSYCVIHGPGKVIEAKVTAPEKKFSRSHMDKVKSYTIYGNGDPRDIVES